MTRLAEFLARELKNSSYRALELKTHVSRGSLENIINEENTEFPKLETLEKVAAAYEEPLWKIIEWAGVKLDLPQGMSDLAQRLTDLSGRMPEIEPIAGYLLKMPADDLRAVLAYLETLDRLRGEGSDGFGR